MEPHFEENAVYRSVKLKVLRLSEDLILNSSKEKIITLIGGDI